MSSVNVEKIARRLARPIPAPYIPPPKPQQSWQQLKAGQWLASRVNIVLRDTQYPAGTLWLVQDPTNLGVKLYPRQGSGVLPWSNPDWKQFFNRARKPKEDTK